MKEKNLTKLWETALSFLYTKEYTESLIAFLHGRHVKSILDCACGVGFPAIQLKKAGFDIFCTDGSSSMIEQFQVNIKKEGLDIPNQVLDWQNLDGLNRKFDTVLCRGNSFIYADSWDSEIKKDFNNFLSDAEKCLQKMYSVLNDGGILFIDMPRQKEYIIESVLVEDLGEKIIGGEMTKMIWSITDDWNKRIRVVHIERFVNAVVYEYDCYGYLLKHEELQFMLKKVGFKKIEQIKLQGENSYEIFIAEK